MEPGCNTKTIAYENRTFLVNMLNFENGMVIAISENSLKIGPMLISISSGPVPSTSVIIPAKSEERITIKKARDLVKEAFEAKSEPIAIKA